MGRYLLFAGEQCYPKGGMNDFVNSGDFVDSLVNEWRSNTNGQFSCWCHVFDSVDMQMVESWEYEKTDGHPKFMKVMS